MTEVGEVCAPWGPTLGFRVNYDAMQVPCPDCDGSGAFELPDNTEPCVKCKAQGWIHITSFAK